MICHVHDGQQLVMYVPTVYGLDVDIMIHVNKLGSISNPFQSNYYITDIKLIGQWPSSFQ